MSSDCSGLGQGEYPSDCQVTEGLRQRAMGRNKTINRSSAWQQALVPAKQVKLLLLDVDGVLTDGNLIYSSTGEETKRFNTQDGLGIRLLQESGVEVGIITARTSEVVARRAEELKCTHLYQGKFDKLTAYEQILKETGLRPMHTAYMGDDLIDLPILNRVAFSAAPANAVVEIRQRVHYITERAGGSGAVREVCDLILEAQDNYSKIVGKFDR